MGSRTLIIGASGQIGTELTLALREELGSEYVIASDIREGSEELMASGPFEIVDATDFQQLEKLIDQYDVDEVYLMAAMLSATAEKFPMRGWDLNMTSLFHVLNLAKEQKISKVFWPSSIAVFGPSSPKEETPQTTVMEPTTVYGISKQAGERWCEYYFRKYGVDVRSIRYPGLISHKTLPGGGTTDYAVEIYHQALGKGHYTSFLKENTSLPMMYMDDAIKATMALMRAPSEALKIRSSYNLSALSFNPQEIAASIREFIPEFKMNYEPDYRQEIADSWPASIDDKQAREDWGWNHEFDLPRMTETMLENLKKKHVLAKK